jgi:predicted DCC family thiol-disulfide oxidoreductase YuxK
LNTFPYIIFYDGVCGLCNKSVQFVLKHDQRDKFMFSALQSEFALKTLHKKSQFDSFILYDNGRFYEQSTAALRVLKILGGVWAIFYVLIIVPPFIRDRVYGFIAKNRYKWFGRYESCPMPDKSTKARFVD